MWSAIAAVIGVLGSLVLKFVGPKPATPVDPLARVRAGTDAVAKIDPSKEAIAHDPANLDC